jgi:hypothetical protein
MPPASFALRIRRFAQDDKKAEKTSRFKTEPETLNSKPVHEDLKLRTSNP